MDHRAAGQPRAVLAARPAHPDDRQHEWAVVDGKQRRLAAAAWLSGDRPVPASWFSPDLVERTVDTVDTDDGPYVTYQGLNDLGLRDTAARFTLPGAEAAVNTVAEEAMIYGLVNGAGVAQTDQDLARAARVAGEA